MRISPKTFHHDNKQPLEGPQKNSKKNSSQKNFRPYSPFDLSPDAYFTFLGVYNEYNI